jgi:hypothetical protein
MDTTIESRNAPYKHLNRLLKKPWRFRCEVIVEKRFPKRNQKEKKRRSTPKSPIRLGLTNKQHNSNIKLQKLTTSNSFNSKNSVCSGEVVGGGLHSAWDSHTHE